MRQLEKVLWTKGLLLTPQHLQAQDRFLEDLLAFRLSAHVSHPWGFADLTIDREALSEGRLSISTARGLFPDGLLFDVPASDPAPPAVSLEESWHPDADSLLVHLTIPEHRTGGVNVSTESADAGTRFRAESVLRRDENTGKAERPVQVARKNFQLLTEGEPLEGRQSLPVARVVRGEADEFGLDPHFVPPVVDMGASEFLQGTARRVLELLSARSAALAGMRRERRAGVADFGVSDVANFWLLHTVNTHLPAFREFVERDRRHPREFYERLIELAGTLTTFSPDRDPTDLPRYTHSGLGPVVAELESVLRELLDSVVPGRHVSLGFSETRPSVYATALDEERFFRASEWYLAVRAGLPAKEVREKVPQLLKVSASDRIDTLIKQALPGISLGHAPDPPGVLPIKLDWEYFRLDTAGEDWDAVSRSRNLAVYIPSDLPDPSLELLLLLPPSESEGPVS